MGLDAQVDGCHVLDRVLLGIESAENSKSGALIEIMAHASQDVGTEGRKREIVRSDEISVQFKSCDQSVDVSTTKQALPIAAASLTLEMLEGRLNLLSLLSAQVVDIVRLASKLLARPRQRRVQDSGKTSRQARHLCRRSRQLEILVGSNKRLRVDNWTGHEVRHCIGWGDR